MIFHKESGTNMQSLIRVWCEYKLVFATRNTQLSTNLNIRTCEDFRLNLIVRFAH